MHTVLLASTLHDPQGRLVDDLPQAIKVVLSYYAGWVVSYTPITNRRIKSILGSYNKIYVSSSKKSHVKEIEDIEYNHLRALEIAYDVAKRRNVNTIQYTDGDRIIMAANRFPSSFAALFSLYKRYSGSHKFYINLRRTMDDFLAHHLPLVQTEKVFNSIYSDVFGMSLDLGSTAHGMSLDVVERILKDSEHFPRVSFPHPKWILIAVLMGAHIHSEEVPRMLTFETPEQYKKDVASQLGVHEMQKHIEKEMRVTQRADTVKFKQDIKSPITKDDIEDNYFLLQQAYESTIGRFANVSQREWRLRFHTQHQYLSILLYMLPVLGLGSQESHYRQKIVSALDQSKKQKERILHILRRKVQDVEITKKETLQDG